MTEFGVVIPVGPHREHNLSLCLLYLSQMLDNPSAVVLVLDGPEVAPPAWTADLPWPVYPVALGEPHRPGMEQPRNIGARALRVHCPEVTHVWFLDSDVIVDQRALSAYQATCGVVGDGVILLGPYDWLAPGQHHPDYNLLNDPRWQSFDGHRLGEVSRERLNDGLACFSGNLVWPIEEFERIGGFWNEIHHGRCEDGELGLRAVAEGVPITFVPRARGWHLWHEINLELVKQRNARDVPMLNARHPWVQAGGLVVVERDGKRFDQRCPNCQQLVNTGEYWSHAVACGADVRGPSIGSDLILPEGM